MLDTYNQPQAIIIPRLREIGFGITVEPTGAFYVFANARRFTNDSYSFAFEVLENAKVGITPGVDFGSNAEGYVRFSYANSLENISEGLNRMERYLANREQGQTACSKSPRLPASTCRPLMSDLPVMHEGEDALAITSAEFITSAVRPDQYPAIDLPEVAFAGRSNVGKSALINCLVQRKKLVRTSCTPGRTQLINFFEINGSFRFVDLPGYGYAKVFPKHAGNMGADDRDLSRFAQNLRGIVHIMDLRHPPSPEDINLWSWLKGGKNPGDPRSDQGR